MYSVPERQSMSRDKFKQCIRMNIKSRLSADIYNQAETEYQILAVDDEPVNPKWIIPWMVHPCHTS